MKKPKRIDTLRDIGPNELSTIEELKVNEEMSSTPKILERVKSTEVLSPGLQNEDYKR
tara:strand:- start:114 stop:287 length:174 start_codon:yes stop_codon:yes gene_type:complete